MIRQLLKSKIHRAHVTESNIDYKGSITIDSDLMEATDILPGEKVLIANINNGARIESYAIPGEAGSGVICMNGGAAKHANVGDILIIMNFCLLNESELESHQPKIIHLDKDNKIIPEHSKA